MTQPEMVRLNLRKKAQDRANACDSAFVIATYDRGETRVMGIWPMDEVDSDEWCAFDAMLVEEIYPEGGES